MESETAATIPTCGEDVMESENNATTSWKGRPAPPRHGPPPPVMNTSWKVRPTATSHVQVMESETAATNPTTAVPRPVSSLRQFYPSVSMLSWSVLPLGHCVLSVNLTTH